MVTHRRDSITAEMLEARRAGKLDQRCRSCGVTSAATEYCCACHGTDLEYRIHVKGETQWCRQDLRPRKPVDENHPMSRKSRAARALRQACGPLAAPMG